jgi:hypothetical protein
MSDYVSKKLFGGTETNFWTFRRFWFLLVKTTITSHYWAKLSFRPFGTIVELFPEISTRQ